MRGHMKKSWSETRGLHHEVPLANADEVLQRKRASLVICDCAHDKDDAKDLLHVMGLDR